nr:unnamed protein product [Callosobruchus analis]
MTSVSCIKCAKVVKNGTYSIKCQTCLNWLHRDCADITIDDIKKYERELKLPDGKRFRCFICLPQSPKNKTRTANDMSISDGSSIDVLFERIKLYLDERLDTHMTKIMEENAKLANVFQTKIANMEVEVRKISSLENKVAQLEQQLTMLTAKIEESDSKHTSIPENPQEERDNSTQKIDVIREINERQLRKKNLIVFNLTEADGGNTTDKVTAQEMISSVCPAIPTNNLKVYRIGKALLNKTRPLRIIMNSHSDVRATFSKIKELKSNPNYKDIALGFDKTQTQLNEYRNLKQELNRRLAQGEMNLKIRYYNDIPKIVAIPNLPKN